MALADAVAPPRARLRDALRPRNALTLRNALMLCGALAVSGCAGDTERVERVRVISGFNQPESVQYDATQDAYFVSNMSGYGSARDGRGYIARFSARDPNISAVVIQSGRNGVTLNAPKGLALSGHTLWVADITVLRAFDARTGAPLAQFDLAPHGAVLLNAVTVAPDGTVFATDTGIVMSDVGILYTDSAKVFAVSPDGAVRIVARGPELRYPNGITWDAGSGRLLVASFHPFEGEVYALDPMDGTRTTLGTGPGRFDGLQLLEDGRILVTSWAGRSLIVLGDGSREPLIDDLWQPADFGIDRRRRIVAIPLALPGKVELWRLPPR